MPEFHDKFRVAANSFKKAMETYDALAKLQESDSRLRIHSISTATDVNMDEIRKLTTYLYQRCPKMDHHNLALMYSRLGRPQRALENADAAIAALPWGSSPARHVRIHEQRIARSEERRVGK